jgi:proline dehydrogenase
LTGLLLRLARQWVAGEKAEDAIARTKKANEKGVLGLVNLLGENIESREEIQKTVQEYLHLLDLIDENQVKAQISIKPTQMGLNVDSGYCEENYLAVTRACEKHKDDFLWLDMENSAYTQKTLDLYLKILDKHEQTGVAIQAYLKRTESDLERILPLGAKVRLVKGAYNEDSSIALKGKELVRKNYVKLLGILFSQKKQNFFAVATHDSAMITAAKELSREHNYADYEYEMLMGVRNNLKQELVVEGRQIREYVPYGPDWFPYSMRRMKEKKSNILLLARSVFWH